MLRLTTDVGSVSFDYADPANVTSSGYDAPTKTSFLSLPSTVIVKPLAIWWHLGGTRQALPTLQGTVQVGYEVSGLPRIVLFPVHISLRQDASSQAPLNETLPFVSNAFIGDWDTTDLYRFNSTGGAVVEVNVSHLWVYNTTIKVTLFGPQGPIVNQTFTSNVDSFFTMRQTLPTPGAYAIEIAAAYPMFYQLVCAISP